MIRLRLYANLYALIDDDRTDLFAFRWYVKRDGPRLYVRRPVGRQGKYVMLHHAVLGKPPKGFVTDHINGAGLDNRRCNLRFVTPSENSMNHRAAYGCKALPPNISDRGARYARNGWKRYRVRVTANYKTHHIGDFATVAEAEIAARLARAQLHAIRP